MAELADRKKWTMDCIISGRVKERMGKGEGGHMVRLHQPGSPLIASAQKPIGDSAKGIRGDL